MTNLRPILAGLVIAGLVSVLSTPSRSVAGDGIDDAVLYAYTADPAVASEIERFREQGYKDGGPRGVLIQGTCGVAGCGHSTLIIHTFVSTGSNPQTRSILTRVHVGPSGEITSVEIMQLKPAVRRIRLNGKIPAPAPELRIKDKIPFPAPPG